jgi:hypothetical protein
VQQLVLLLAAMAFATNGMTILDVKARPGITRGKDAIFYLQNL